MDKCQTCNNAPIDFDGDFYNGYSKDFCSQECADKDLDEFHAFLDAEGDARHNDHLFDDEFVKEERL